MLDRLLSVSTTILRLIYGRKLWVNEIIKQTSPDRTYVIQALETMEKARLLTQGPRSIGRKRSVELTSLGNEIATLYFSLDNYMKGYNEIYKFLQDNFVKYEDRNTLKNILKSRGWDEYDIAIYDELQSSFRNYEWTFFDNMLDVVHLRSLKILTKYKINIQLKRNDIIRILLEAVSHKVIAFVYGNLLVRHGKEKISYGGNEIDIQHWINSTERRLLRSFGCWGHYRIPLFAINELRKASLSYLKLVDPENNTLLEEVHQLQNYLDDRKLSTEGLKRSVANCVLDVFSKYLNKSQ
jgi:hypothetical protein